MKTKIYLKQCADGQWRYGKIIDAGQIVRWTARSWSTRSAAVDAAQRDYPGIDLIFQDQETE
jgi:hypothetical protein